MQKQIWSWSFPHHQKRYELIGGAAQFAATYPFPPYQFNLLQKVFTQIRQMGSSGKHLASGERSLLDAFQIAALALKDDVVGQLAPFHLFYRAIERFLDTAVSQVVIQAGTNDRLDAFDLNLLKTLFMVKYLKELRANVENLTTLSLEHVEQDRLVDPRADHVSLLDERSPPVLELRQQVDPRAAPGGALGLDDGPLARLVGLEVRALVREDRRGIDRVLELG